MSLFGFFIESIMLGAGLAMDAFSVSLANGMNEPKMGKGRAVLIAGTFAGFQFAMPMIGWILIRTLMEVFGFMKKLVPWTALFLLLFIGGKMLYEGIKGGESEDTAVGTGALLLQGVATSIDALSVGLTFANDGFSGALSASLIIMAVTFAICLAGLYLGRKIGTALSGKASILGGIILIGIGIEIFISSLL